jgi:hypothetical protein
MFSIDEKVDKRRRTVLHIKEDAILSKSNETNYYYTSNTTIYWNNRGRLARNTSKVIVEMKQPEVRIPLFK